MQAFDFPIKNKLIILALGAESAGNFSIFNKNKIYFSQDFGDLLEEKNWLVFQKAVLGFLKENSIKPDIIITDLHPLMKTTFWGKQLSKKFKAQHLQVQHHHAHIFSALGERLSQDTKYKILNTGHGIAMDGTGYGIDGKIWGGEIFQLKIKNEKLKIIERIGSLENQVLLGGELAIQEPARMVISILSKFLSKKEIYPFIKKYYAQNEFELLYNQLEQGFNCIETSSAGRILDAVSLLLGFCDNQRKYKHEPIDLLKKNSTIPYKNLKPIITINTNNGSSLKNSKLIQNSKFKIQNYSNPKFILQTTPLFEYLINNLHEDKKRLAATAQLYLAEGLHEMIIKSSAINHLPSDKNTSSSIYHSCLPAGRLNFGLGSPTIFAAGGVTGNRIISKYFSLKNIYLNNSIPRGDAGLSFGQVAYFLLK